MPFVAKIVNEINTALKAGSLKGSTFQLGMFYGLTQKAYRNDDEGRTVPIIVTDTGEVDTTVDDKYPFQMYHRCTGIEYAQPSSGMTFGNGRQTIELALMTAFVYADRDRIGVQPDELAYLIAAGMPKTITDAVGIRAEMVPTSVDFNIKNILQGEYGDASKASDTRLLCLALSYTARITSDLSCVSCINC